jgi:DNA (cytosine-5)-methyltransferase 3A
MSCGQIALERAGIKVDNYFASEIDKHAIQVTQHNYPNTIQLGDVSEWYEWDLPKIDLVIGGSPCQGFSASGKGLNFDDPRSKLFFKFTDVLLAVKPKYFLLENVKMQKRWEDVITNSLGVEPIEINSSLVSAQNRVRLYWTNIPGVEQPKDKGINLTDIIETDAETNPAAIRGRKLNKGTILGRRLNSKGKREDYNKDIPITQCLEVRASNTNKSNCLTTVEKDNVLTTMLIGRHPDAFKNKLPFRYYTATEYERLQTVPEGYTSIVSDSKRKKMLGNGWTVDVITHIFKTLKADLDK